MTTARNEKPVCQVSDQSVLRTIFSDAKLARLERCARASRLRDILLSLRPAALGMGASDRAAYAEMVELARAEHQAACEEEAAAVEVESLAQVFSEAMVDLNRLRDENAKMMAAVMRMHATQSNSSSLSEGQGSFWDRLVYLVKKPKFKE